MDVLVNRLIEFHKAFGLSIGSVSEAGACAPDQQELHYKLMLEELNEFKEACEENDPVGIADGLGDVLFVLMSSVVAHGLQDKFARIFEEICRSNMSKLGEDGEPIRREDGKIMRGENYSRPNLRSIMYPPKVNDRVMIYGQEASVIAISADRDLHQLAVVSPAISVPSGSSKDGKTSRNMFSYHELEVINNKSK